MAKQKEPTATCLVLEYLRKLDNFTTAVQVREATGLNEHRTSAALYHLRNYAKVADCLREGDQLWWFALPEEQDKRSYIQKERVVEVKPRKLRKGKKKVD